MNEQMQETRLRGSIHFPFERYPMRTGQQLISVACHWQEDMELVAVHSGQVSLLLEGRRLLLSPGDVACINPCQPHSLRGLTMDTAYDAYVFPLKHLLFAQEEENQLQFTRLLAEGKLGFPPLLPPGSAAQSLVYAILQADRERPAAGQLQIKALLLQLIVTLAREKAFIPLEPSRQGDLCRTILSFIHQHYGGKCSVAQVAAACGLSPAYFSAFFTRHFAQRYSDYLLCYRLEQACALLLRTEQSITEIALATGFGSSSHFIQRFRQHKGITPLAYRHQHK